MRDSTGRALLKVRCQMKNVMMINPSLDAYIVTSKDAHLNGCLAHFDRRLEYLSGFTGTEGTAIITESDALLWTDEQYHVQAVEELDSQWKLINPALSISEWLAINLNKGSRVGSDPRLMSFALWIEIKNDLELVGLSLIAVNTNLVDLIWEDRLLPLIETGCIYPQPLELSGRPSKDKVEDVRQKMIQKGADMLIVSALDEIAWILNLRGSDIPYNPVFFSFLIVMLNQVHLFIDEVKISLAVRNHFNKEDLPVCLHAYDSMSGFITNQIGSNPAIESVWICSPANYNIYSLIPDHLRYCYCSPITLLKAIKNEVEVKGMVNAHLKDAIAMCRYFAWLEKEVPNGLVSELNGAYKLDFFRRGEDGFMGPSFVTISSSGPNTAKNYYHPTEESDRILSCNELYLCNAGSQFRDGTTEVSRTLHFGTPSEFEKECFTKVLKGQIALTSATFPNLTKGNYLDVFARKALWDVGLDYRHSTGHGIGSYLHVHEGPTAISSKPYLDDPGLQANMFLSNEPGYYHETDFGIRLENVVQVVPAGTLYDFYGKGFMTFRNITLVPFQKKMLIPSCLTEDELDFLNDYHSQCLEVLGPILKDRGLYDVFDWLVSETEQIQNIYK